MSLRLICLAALLIALFFAGAEAAPPSPPEGWTDGYVLANGFRIHYWRTGGNKPVLVMAHGSSDDGLCWTNLARELTGSFDIIMFDARGHGLSDPPSPNDPADAQVEDLAGLIRELKLVKPILMGHSMGSASVAWFAAKYPDVPRAIVLEDPGLAMRRPGAGAPGGPGAGDREKRRADILARNNMTFEQIVEQCMKGTPQWGRSECEFWAPSKRRHHPNTALGGIGGRPPISELFPKITCPTLILKADAQGDLRKQNEDFDSIKPYLLEETYEVLDAIDARDWPSVAEELGDLMLEAVFFAQMGSEQGLFRIEDALQAVNEKLVRRHPHVFGSGDAKTPGEVKQRWDQIKAGEKESKGLGERPLLASVPRAMPALVEAQQLTSRAATVGFDWETPEQVLDKLHEELGELAEARRSADRGELENEIGDLLFVLVNLARFLKVDAEQALRRTNAKFRSRFAYVERKLAEHGRTAAGASLDEMEALWQEAKGRP